MHQGAFARANDGEEGVGGVVADDQYINTQQPPASTAVEVRRLVRDDLLIEVEAVAAIASFQPMTATA
jgi:enamine deaminase RidA (YjgF/YER057c/UK114 family)